MIDVGHAMLIDRDVAATVHVNASCVEIQVAAVGDRSDCENGMGGSHCATIVATNNDALTFAFHRLRSRSLQKLHASAKEILFEDGSDLGVLSGQNLLTTDDQGDLGPERLEHVHELDTGDA